MLPVAMSLSLPEGMLLAVTGGGGFIAGRFMDRVQEMSAAGGALRIRALASSEASHGRMATMGASIEARIMARDLAGLREQLRGVHVLLHAGWSTVPATADRDPLADVHVNAAGSLLLFQAAIAEGVRRIVFISSGGMVYGEALSLPIHEDHVLDPKGAYGASKLIVERYLTAMARPSGVEHVILRPSNVFGRKQAHDKPQGVIEHWMQAALEGREARTWADLDAERDYLHIDDLVDAVLLAVAAPVAHTVMNVGSGRGTTLHELAALVARISGRPFNVTGASAARGAIRRNVLDGGRLRESHGWIPKVSLEEGMHRVCHALLQNANR